MIDNIEINSEQNNFCAIVQTDDNNFDVNLNTDVNNFCIEVQEGIAPIPHKHPISDIIGLQDDLDAINDSLDFLSENKADLVDGKVPASQLPSYVDDVVEYPTLGDFPITGESGKIYLALDTNLTYRWGGSSYVEISPSLALGETSSTAYRGDRGKIAYDHSQTLGNPHGTTLNDVTTANNTTENTIDVGGVKSDYYDVDTTATPINQIGRIKWNTEDGTFDLGLLNDVTLQAGQELHFYAKAQGTIANGAVVQFAGSQGNHLLIKTAVASEINANPNLIVGIATQSFSNNQFGYVTSFGKVRDLNTSAFSEGTILWFDSVNGGLTSTKPAYPNARVLMCAVVRSHATQGTLMVRPHVFEYSNWDEINSKPTNFITGSVSVNRLVRATGTNIVGNSYIYDNGAAIGIGTTSPLTSFTVADDYISQVSSGCNSLFGYDGSGGLLVGTISNNYLKLITNDIERLRILTNGNIGLNTTTPSERLDVNGNVKATSFIGALSGNATTATTLQTARTLTIGNTGKTFDGSANVSWSLAEIGAIGGSGNSGKIAKFTSSGTIASSIIEEYGTYAGVGGTNNNFLFTVAGNFLATGGITGTLTGNASTATTLETARTITIGATGKTFNGSANISFSLAEIGAQATLTNPITGTGANGRISFFNGTTTQTSDSNLFWDNTNKRLGIGTTSPTTVLDLGGASNKAMTVQSATNNRAYYGAWQDVAVIGVNRNPSDGSFTDNTKASSDISLVGQSGNGFIVFGTTATNGGIPTERMRITSGGNVGIGTTSPSGKFEIDSSGGFTWGFPSTAVAKIGTKGTGGSLIVSTPSLNSFYESGLAIDGTYSGGKSVINISSFGVLSGGPYGSDIAFRTTSETTLAERMRITSGGDVCIGTTTANSRLNVSSPFGNNLSLYDTSGFSGASFIGFFANTTLIGSITRVGTTNSVAYNTTSDYRLKEDLQEINGLEKLSKIKVYDFKWKGDDARMDGVLAHELKEVIPYAVTGEKDGEQMQSVDYSKLVPVLIKAIQEQQEEINKLKTLLLNK